MKPDYPGSPTKILNAFSFKLDFKYHNYCTILTNFESFTRTSLNNFKFE